MEITVDMYYVPWKLTSPPRASECGTGILTSGQMIPTLIPQKLDVPGSSPRFLGHEAAAHIHS